MQQFLLVEGKPDLTFGYEEKCSFPGCSLVFPDFLHRTANEETALGGVVGMEQIFNVQGGSEKGGIIPSHLNTEQGTWSL